MCLAPGSTSPCTHPRPACQWACGVSPCLAGRGTMFGPTAVGRGVAFRLQIHRDLACRQGASPRVVCPSGRVCLELSAQSSTHAQAGETGPSCVRTRALSPSYFNLLIPTKARTPSGLLRHRTVSVSALMNGTPSDVRRHPSVRPSTSMCRDSRALPCYCDNAVRILVQPGNGHPYYPPRTHRQAAARRSTNNNVIPLQRDRGPPRSATRLSPSPRPPVLAGLLLQARRKEGPRGARD